LTKEKKYGRIYLVLKVEPKIKQKGDQNMARMKVEFDHSKLAGRIIEKYGSQAALAKELNWPPSKLSNRMNNKVHFDDDDIWTLCRSDCLDIPPDYIPLYFFTQKF
jgi:hypothetical protein